MKNTFIEDKIAVYYKQLLKNSYLIKEINFKNDIIEWDDGKNCCYIDANGYLALKPDGKYKWDKACIYIKPLSILFEYADVSVMYSGGPTIEYYNEYYGEWRSIKDANRINVNGTVKLRIWLNPTDTVFSISLVIPKSNIEKKYKIVKAIDFSKDLIEDLPAKYFIDAEKSGKLNFVCEDIYEIKPEDYEVVVGDFRVNEEGVSLIPNHGYSDKKNFYDGSYLIKQNISEDADIVYMELIKGSKLNVLSILLINKQYYDVMVKIKDKLMEHSSEALVNTGSRGLILNFFAKSHTRLAERYELDYENLYESYKPLDNKISVAFYPKDNYIRINDESISFSESVDLADKKHLYLWAADEQYMVDPEITIRKIAYSKKSGCLYIKPFCNQYGSVKILFLDNNEADVEYYEESSATWKKIYKDSGISEKIIKIRVKMTSNSEIYGIFFVLDN